MNYFNYFSEIEELFIRRRGRNLLLSPLDWALIETWQERGVPLHVILRGIETVFDGADKQPAKKRPIKSLLYCKEEIEAQYSAWLERQVGRRVSSPQPEVVNQKSESELFSDEMIAAHLARTAAEIGAAKQEAGGDLRKTLEVVSESLAKLDGKNNAARQLEESLENLDALIDASLLKSFETAELKSEIERQIASYKNKMEREVYERTFDLMLLKRLREQARIPRLSLFNL